MTDRVREQYEAHPYPARDPAEEKKRLVTGSPSDVREIDHYLFAGRRDWTQPFRALVAGGGTGDGLVMLAQQLADRNCPAEIRYLDLSQASARIAQARVAARGLEKYVAFHRGSLVALGEVAPGPYDYIDCVGVLHHLEDPAKGLHALAGQVSPQGGMGLMVYGALGRTGVYDAQALLRALCGAAPDPERLSVARRLLAALPATNRLKRNPYLADHLRGDDSGLYDLLLHGRDRAFTVAEFASLVRGAGLEIASFIEPARYDPATYLADPELRRRLEAHDPASRAAIAELLAGNMKTHVAYAVPAARAGTTVARPDSPEAVPVGREMDFPALAKGLPEGGGAVTADFDGLAVRFALPAVAKAILAACDGRNDLAAIHRQAAPQDSFAAFLEKFRAVYAAFNGINRMLLRTPRGG